MRCYSVLIKLFDPDLQLVLHVVQLVIIFEGVESNSSNNFFKITFFKRLNLFTHVLKLGFNVLALSGFSQFPALLQDEFIDFVSIFNPDADSF